MAFGLENDENEITMEKLKSFVDQQSNISFEKDNHEEKQLILKQLENMKVQQQNLVQQLLNNQMKSLEIQDEMTKMDQTIQSKQKELSLIVQEHQNLTLQLQQDTTEYERQTKEIKKQRQYWIQQARLYQHLGLEFDCSIPNMVSFVFTQIDKQRPHRVFTLTLTITELGSYQVKNCQPAIGDIATMIHELNRTADLASFTKILRKRFIRCASRNE